MSGHVLGSLIGGGLYLTMVAVALMFFKGVGPN